MRVTSSVYCGWFVKQEDGGWKWGGVKWLLFTHVSDAASDTVVFEAGINLTCSIKEA